MFSNYADDALLDVHEPGTTESQLVPIFEQLKKGLGVLLDSVRDSGVAPSEDAVKGDFPEEKQLAFSREVIMAMGYDIDAGRIDLATHPFCTGFSNRDVRITWRFQEDDLRPALFGLMHEAGHALVAHLLPHADPPYKVTIVARGQTGGHTRFIPEVETSLVTQNQLEARMAAAMGGRVAEEVMFYEVTTGAGNDLEQATNIARAMITRLGMSKKLGPRTFGKREELVFLGREISEQADYSDSIAESIDEEVHGLLDVAYLTATRLIKNNSGKLSALAKHLIEHETIEGDDLRNLLDSSPAAA